MPKVLIKQGFLGLGRPIEKWYCDKCGVECQNLFYREPRMYCRACANSIDPDIVHMWSRDEVVRSYKTGEFFLDPRTAKENSSSLVTAAWAYCLCVRMTWSFIAGIFVWVHDIRLKQTLRASTTPDTIRMEM